MPTLHEGQVLAETHILKALTKYKGFLLADCPGYGKTAVSIAISKKALSKGPILIIAPAYIVLNWFDELILWGVKKKDICIIDSTKQILSEANYYIVSYNMAAYIDRTRGADGRPIKKPGLIFQQLYRMEWGLLICDEGHALKTPGTQRTRLIAGTGNNKKTNLYNRAYKVLLLTGTPLINRIDELYNLIIKIAPEIFNNISRMDYILHFAGHIESTPWGIKHKGVKNADELKALIAPVMLARASIEGLPDRVDRPIPLKIHGKDLTNFIKQEEDFITRHGLTAANLDSLQKVQDIEGPTIAEIRQQTALYKIPAVMSALGDAWEKEENLVVGVYHRAVQIAVKNEIEKKFPGKRLAIINGGVDKKKRHAIIKAYQAGEIDCLLTTISAMREGVNVTRGFSLFIVEFPWTPAELEQYIARVHRKGQKNIVYVHYFFFKGGIDKIMMQCLKGKERMIKKIMT